MALPTAAAAASDLAELEASVTVAPQGGYVAFQCPVRASKDNDPFYDESQKEPPTAADEARMADGRTFESDLGPIWHKKLKKRIFMVPECDRTPESKRRREQLTLKTMKDPGDAVVIWNCRLPAILEDTEKGDLPRIAEPDFLVLMGRKDDGTTIWAPGDVKHHKTFEGTAKGLTWHVSEMDDPEFDKAVLTDMGPGQPKVKPSKQLAHYRRVIEHLGHAQDVSDGSPYWACTIGKELKLIWRNLDEPVGRPKKSPQTAYDESFAERISIIRRARARALEPTLLPLVEPEWKDECTGCPWREVCHDELKFDLDHITLLPAMTPSRAKPHYALGVKSVGALARLDHATAVAVDLKLDVPALIAAAKAETDWSLPAVKLLPRTKGVVEQAKALSAAGITTIGDVASLDQRTAAYAGTGVYRLAEAIDQARVTKVGKVHRARNVDFVEIPRAAIEIDVDVEDADGIVYLIGARARGYRKRDGDEKVRVEMHSFVTWEHTDEAEGKNFAEFWQYVENMRSYAKARRYGLRFYHYTSKEISTFKALAVKHVGKPGVPTLDELDELFGSNNWVDLYPIVSTQMIWPTESLTLKKLAGHVRHSWRDECPGGDQSIAWYMEAIKNPSEKAREESRQRILIYNEDDVIAQVAIRDWVTRFGEMRKPGQKLPGIESLDKRFRRRSIATQE